MDSNRALFYNRTLVYSKTWRWFSHSQAWQPCFNSSLPSWPVSRTSPASAGSSSSSLPTGRWTSQPLWLQHHPRPPCYQPHQNIQVYRSVKSEMKLDLYGKYNFFLVFLKTQTCAIWLISKILISKHLPHGYGWDISINQSLWRKSFKSAQKRVGGARQLFFSMFT